MENKIEKPKNDRSAFTLIELLVVVSIIMMLAGLLFTAGLGALKQGKKAKARADIKNLEVALSHYYSEYGKWPSCAGGTATDRIKDWPSLYDILTGGEGAPTCTASTNSGNPKKIVFMTPNTLDTCTNSGTYFKDPWNRPYNFIFDFGYDNKISFSDNTDAGFVATTASGCSGTSNTANGFVMQPTSTVVNRGVIIWSNGVDTKNGWADTITPTAGGADDLPSWK